MPLWGWLALAAGLGMLLSSTVPSGGGGGGVSRSAMQNVQSLPDTFWSTLWEVAGRVGASPYNLGLLLFEESNLDPHAANGYGCVGLNQFCPGTYESYVPMPPGDYLQLPAEEQLSPYIERYWASRPAGSLDTVRDAFWVSFLPATYVPNAPPSHVITTNPGIIKANPIGSSLQTGQITAGDIDAYLASVAQSPAWKLAEQKIAAADPGSPSSSPATDPSTDLSGGNA